MFVYTSIMVENRPLGTYKLPGIARKKNMRKEKHCYFLKNGHDLENKRNAEKKKSKNHNERT